MTLMSDKHGILCVINVIVNNVVIASRQIHYTTLKLLSRMFSV